MPRVEPDVIDFAEDGPGRLEVVEAMAEVADTLAGWVTLEPLFDSEALPPVRSTFLDVFSGRGPVVPDGSWVPGERKGDRTVGRLSLGVRHPSGPKAVLRLAESGCPVPDGWRVVQDHPKRGLVLEARPGTEPDAGATLSWVLAAIAVLTPLELSGQWRATLHQRG